MIVPPRPDLLPKEEEGKEEDGGNTEEKEQGEEQEEKENKEQSPREEDAGQKNKRDSFDLDFGEIPDMTNAKLDFDDIGDDWNTWDDAPTEGKTGETDFGV
jgi:hypothetical protein